MMCSAYKKPLSIKSSFYEENSDIKQYLNNSSTKVENYIKEITEIAWGKIINNCDYTIYCAIIMKFTHKIITLFIKEYYNKKYHGNVIALAALKISWDILNKKGLINEIEIINILDNYEEFIEEFIKIEVKMLKYVTDDSFFENIENQKKPANKICTECCFLLKEQTGKSSSELLNFLKIKINKNHKSKFVLQKEKIPKKCDKESSNMNGIIYPKKYQDIFLFPYPPKYLLKGEQLSPVFD